MLSGVRFYFGVRVCKIFILLNNASCVKLCSLWYQSLVVWTEHLSDIDKHLFGFNQLKNKLNN